MTVEHNLNMIIFAIINRIGKQRFSNTIIEETIYFMTGHGHVM